MTLQNNLNAVHKEIMTKVPEIGGKFDADTEEALRNGLGSESLKEGDHAPDFELPDQVGHTLTSVDLRKKGILVVSFYRGHWCPYCNLELNALQNILPELNDLGASLVAISPQVPDESLTTAEKNNLTFPVLSDVDNVIARQYGLVFTLSEELRPLYAEFGIDIPKANGTGTFELPVPGTFVVGQNGTILAAYVNGDYKQRIEPNQILDILKEIKS